MICSPRLGSLLLFSFLSLTPEPPSQLPSVCRTSGRAWHRSLAPGRCTLASRLALSGADVAEGGAWRRQEWDNRIRVDVRYDGERFAGFQTGNADAITIHQLVQAACRDAFAAPALELVGAGRTDAGVHALIMPTHIDLPLTPHHISLRRPGPLRGALSILNAVLPPDIRITSLAAAPRDWHAQFSSEGKTYHYLVYAAASPDPLLRRTHHHCATRHELDVPAMREAAALLLGVRDFTSFTNTDRVRAGRLKPIKNLQRLDIFDHPAPHLQASQGEATRSSRQFLTFAIEADGFLYRMCRILVGTLLEVGRGRMAPGEVAAVLARRDRTAAGPCVPPHALYLASVRYNAAAFPDDDGMSS
ncbi:pseudouridine synthase [Baffinella frigidus]|nr:pseudouridine synthase [Cryptophyta sp. CCMP2293]